MKTQLQLTSNGKTLGTLDLQPSTLRNLKAFAKSNKVSPMNMIDLSIRFTTGTAKETDAITIESPDQREFTGC